MPDPRTTPHEHDKPVFQPTTPTPGSPTPEDPHQHEPIHDPPVDPEHDAPRRASERILYDEDRKPG